MTSGGIAGTHWASNLVEFLLLNIFHCDSLEVIHKVRKIGGEERGSHWKRTYSYGKREKVQL